MTWTPDTIQAMLVAILGAATIFVGALVQLVRLLIQLRAEVRSNGSSMEALRQDVQQVQTSISNGTANGSH